MPDKTIAGLSTDAKSTLPNITGNPKLDAMLRNTLIAVSASLATLIVAWLNKHGVMTWLNAYGVIEWLNQMGVNPTALIFGAVLSFMLTVAGFVWSIVQQRLARNAMVSHVVSAMTTGQVSPAMIGDATAAQVREIIKAAPAQLPATEQAITKKLNDDQLKRSTT